MYRVSGLLRLLFAVGGGGRGWFGGFLLEMAGCAEDVLAAALDDEGDGVDC